MHQSQSALVWIVRETTFPKTLSLEKSLTTGLI